MRDTDAETGVYGMVLLGTDTVYATYMPLPTPPYDVQAILRVELSNDTYRTARERYGTSALFTVRPETETETVGVGSVDPGASIPAELFFGHFDEDGRHLGDLTVRVQQKLFSERIERGGAEALVDPSPLGYLLFGREQLFLTHRITRVSGFSQVVTAQYSGFWTSPPGPEGVLAVTLPGREDDMATRLRPGEQITAVLADETADLQVLAEVYFGADDLSPDLG